MKVTIDISQKTWAELLKNTGAKTKRGAIITALKEFNRRERLKALAERLHGSLPNFMTQKDLRIMREDTKWKS